MEPLSFVSQVSIQELLGETWRGRHHTQTEPRGGAVAEQDATRPNHCGLPGRFKKAVPGKRRLSKDPKDEVSKGGNPGRGNSLCNVLEAHKGKRNDGDLREGKLPTSQEAVRNHL